MKRIAFFPLLIIKFVLYVVNIFYKKCYKLHSYAFMDTPLVRVMCSIGDFADWTDPQAYQQSFECLLSDLKIGKLSLSGK